MVCLADKDFAQRLVLYDPGWKEPADRSGTYVGRHMENLGVYHSLERILIPEVLPGSVWNREKEGVDQNGDVTVVPISAQPASETRWW